MQQKGTGARRHAERDATQPIAGQPRTDDEEEGLEQPEQVPSFLTARELQARDAARPTQDEEETGERHASASSKGSKGEPTISDDEPPRGERGLPEERSEKLRRGKGSGKH